MELDRGSGTTIDMSATGIFFESATDSLDTPVGAGGEIRFAVSVDDGIDGLPVRLDCMGTVMRVEPAGDRMRVGATIERAMIRQ